MLTLIVKNDNNTMTSVMHVEGVTVLKRGHSKFRCEDEDVTHLVYSGRSINEKPLFLLTKGCECTLVNELGSAVSVIRS